MAKTSSSATSAVAKAPLPEPKGVEEQVRENTDKSVALERRLTELQQQWNQFHQNHTAEFNKLNRELFELSQDNRRLQSLVAKGA